MADLDPEAIRSLASRLRTYAEVRIRAAASVKADIHRTADVLEQLLDTNQRLQKDKDEQQVQGDR